MLKGNENKKWLVNILVVIVCLTVVGTAQAVTLAPGDLIVADWNGSLGGPVGSPAGGRIIKVDPSTGAQTMISSGNLLDGPYSVAIDAAGNIIVLDASDNQIIKVDPADGSQTLISQNGLFVNPQGIAIDAAGNIIVADSFYGGTGGIIKVDPVTGAQTVISSGGSINYPSSVTIDGAGNIYVTSSISGSSFLLTVIKVNPSTGAQTVISSGTFNIWYGGIVIDDATGNIFVSELYYNNGIIKVDPSTGAQSFLTSGSPFQDPYQLDIDPSGNIIAADTNWHWPGRIIRVDPASGGKTLISSGGLLVDPGGIVVVIEADPIEEIAIDIKPGSCPNPLRVNFRGNGVFTVAIVGGDPDEGGLDVRTVDITTITLEGVAPIRSRFEDVSTPFDGEECECSTEGPDGFDDLVLKFSRADILDALEDTHGDLADLPNRAELTLTLLATLMDEGTPLEGKDCLRILNRGAIKRKK